MTHVDFIIVGQGLAGTCLAWHFHWLGYTVAIIDDNNPTSASRIAAGLIVPITGKRLALTWRLRELLPVAFAFYERLAAFLSTDFVYRLPTVRLFVDAGEAARFATPSRRLISDLVSLPNPPLDPDHFSLMAGAFEMNTSARINIWRYLESSQDYFASHLSLYHYHVDPRIDIYLSTESIIVPPLSLTADHIVFCQGYSGRSNPFFSGVRFNPTKGELLTLSIPRLTERRIVNRGVWLAPLGGGYFRAGATYDRTSFDANPTSTAREEICSRLRAFLKLPFEVIDHHAAVRPIIRESRPILGVHPRYPRVAFFNGLGSKGALLAPYFAGQLASLLTGRGAIDPDVNLAAYLGDRSCG